MKLKQKNKTKSEKDWSRLEKAKNQAEEIYDTLCEAFHQHWWNKGGYDNDGVHTDGEEKIAKALFTRRVVQFKGVIDLCTPNPPMVCIEFNPRQSLDCAFKVFIKYKGQSEKLEFNEVWTKRLNSQYDKNNVA